jgi:hypothetical protein
MVYVGSEDITYAFLLPLLLVIYFFPLLFVVVIRLFVFVFVIFGICGLKGPGFTFL